MRYISTRGKAPALSFAEATLTGLARDGGLYVPDTWPHFSVAEIRAWKNLPYAQLAARIMRPFVGDDLADHELAEILEKSIARFPHPEIAPVRDIFPDRNIFLLELFHGATLAFKDYALQFLGQTLAHLLKKSGDRLTLVGATSGDTGSAAIHGCRGIENVRLFVLHPQGRVSDVQRRQMTTVDDDNVFNLAVDGNFDDCQMLVKDLFNDFDFRDRVRLSAINSINWTRILAQVVYYFHAALRVNGADAPVSFAVPTGNFGNIYAAFVAHKIGLPIERLILATNHNDILTRYFHSGVMQQAAVTPSLSPSMDIQRSSNFERLLFDMCGRNGDAVTAHMENFSARGLFTQPLVPPADVFVAHRLSDDGILDTIRRTYAATGVMIDPHTATGMAAAEQHTGTTPVIALACAHPAKFPEAVQRATGMPPSMPPHIAALFSLPERYTLMANNTADLKQHILKA